MGNSKVQYWVKLKCLCLIAATMAFTMGVFIALFLNLPRRAISFGDSSPQVMPLNWVWPESTGSQVRPETSTVQVVEETNNKVTPSGSNQSLLTEDQDVDADHLQLSIKQEKQCDIFQGKWVEDFSEPPYRNETCPFLSQGQNCPGNGRPDTGYLNWRWNPNDCDLPRFDGRAFLELMRGKTIAFVGDSVTRNQYESLMCTLWQITKPHPNGNRKFQRWIFREYNFKVIRVWSSWLVRQSTEAIDFAPENMTKLHLDELDDKISEFLPSFDVLVVASGHWWPKKAAYIAGGKVVGGQGWWNNKYKKEHDVLSGYSVAMKTALKALMDSPDYKGLTILRTYSPEHYEGGTWNTGGSCTGKTKPLTDGEVGVNKYMDTLYGHQMVAVKEAEKIAEANSKRLRVMDITRSFSYRADGHPGPYRNNDPNKRVERGPDGKPPPQDCLHWCMPGPIDTWNQYLFEMLKREFNPNI